MPKMNKRECTENSTIQRDTIASMKRKNQVAVKPNQIKRKKIQTEHAKIH